MLTETILQDAVLAVRMDSYYQSATERRQTNGLIEALNEDRGLIGIVSDVTAARVSKEQNVYIDVLTDLPEGVGDELTCTATDTISDKRIPVTTSPIVKGFKINSDGLDYSGNTDPKNTTFGYEGVLAKSLRSVFIELHRGMETQLEAAMDAITGYPTTTYPYAQAGTGAIAIPFTDWKLNGTNTAPIWLGNVAALFRQFNYDPMYRLIGNANFSIPTESLFAQGPGNAVNSQWQRGPFLANYTNVNGSFLDNDGIKAYAFKKGEHSFHTWAFKTTKGSEGDDKRWFWIEDPIYAGVFWDVYYTLDCSNGRPVEEWIFSNFLGHIYAPSRLREGNGLAEPATLQLTLAVA